MKILIGILILAGIIFTPWALYRRLNRFERIYSTGRGYYGPDKNGNAGFYLTEHGENIPGYESFTWWPRKVIVFIDNKPIVKWIWLDFYWCERKVTVK